MMYGATVIFRRPGRFTGTTEDPMNGRSRRRFTDRSIQRSSL
jgi:hypothetical protein